MPLGAAGGFRVQGHVLGYNGPQADKAHLTYENVDELGQLVDLGLPEEAPWL
jgi:hypothetical protein